MIIVDTNILVRYAVKDDRAQAVAATGLLAANRCLVWKTVLLECARVLASPKGYGLPRSLVHERLLHILGLPKVEMEDAAEVARALAWYAGGGLILPMPCTWRPVAATTACSPLTGSLSNLRRDTTTPPPCICCPPAPRPHEPATGGNFKWGLRGAVVVGLAGACRLR